MKEEVGGISPFAGLLHLQIVLHQMLLLKNTNSGIKEDLEFSNSLNASGIFVPQGSPFIA